MTGGSTAWRETISASYDDYADLADYYDQLTSLLLSDAEGGTSDVMRQQFAGWKEQMTCVGLSQIIHPAVASWVIRWAELADDGKPVEVMDHLKDGVHLRESALASHDRARSAWQQWGLPIDPGPTDGFYDERVREATQKAQGEYKWITRYSRLTIAEEPPDARLLRRAVDLIEAVWPEARHDLEMSVRAMVFFYGDRVAAFTDFRTLGALYLNKEYVQQRPAADVAEIVLHEGAHSRIDAFLATRPMLKDGDSTRRFRTPLRTDLRPLSGVVQQAFVLSRLSHFYARMVERMPEDTSDWQEKREHNLAALVDCLDILERDDVDLTEWGGEFVASARQEATVLLKGGR